MEKIIEDLDKSPRKKINKTLKNSSYRGKDLTPRVAGKNIHSSPDLFDSPEGQIKNPKKVDWKKFENRCLPKPKSNLRMVESVDYLKDRRA